METYSSLLEAFEALNRRKRADPQSLSPQEQDRWKQLRREIELALFRHTVEPANDTREFLRVPVSLTVRFKTRDELRDRYISVLGERGLAISTVDPLPLGTRLDLEIVLSRRRFSFNVQGEVVWVRRGDDPATSGMGIRFLNLSPEQQRLIHRLVDDNLRDNLGERRRYTRVDARLQVQFVYADGFFELQTKDISVGGLFIATEHLLAPGERVRLVLHMPGERPAIKAVAEVVRVVNKPREGQPIGLGVRFVDLTEADRQAIQSYLRGQFMGDGRRPASIADDERRRHARLGKRISLRFQSVHALGVSYARNISSGGVFIQTPDKPPPLDSEVEVTLIHPVTLQSLSLSGKVIRVVEPDPSRPEGSTGVAVEFEALPAKKRALLGDFLQYYVQFEHEPNPEEG